MNPTQRTSVPHRRRNSEPLEERVLIDADVSDFIAMDGAHDPHDANASPSGHGPKRKPRTVSWYGRMDGGSSEVPGLHPRQYAFVDVTVQQHETRVQDLVRNGQPLEIIYLDPKRNGIKQMAESLTGAANLDVVYLISDGWDGLLQLGDQAIDRADLALDHASSLRAIGASLAADGDFLLYGCGLVGSTAGLNLIDALSRLTGVEVAALDASIGNAPRDENWELELLRSESVGQHCICVSASGTEGLDNFTHAALMPPPESTDQEPIGSPGQAGFDRGTFDLNVFLETSSCSPWCAGFSPHFDVFHPRGIRVDGFAIYGGNLSPAVEKVLTAASEIASVSGDNRSDTQLVGASAPEQRSTWHGSPIDSGAFGVGWALVTG
ncbi:DUF4347 domain-containing protein [Stieleria sp. ICT_E10.1]|uniref:DUF4347 domain-containing protein n=1 Tax=Stieleria sedimenti TaxID=2976331 RepID=UPI002180245F|nr:DUF4347 domain-containing protein [Stieleria sedimenti]MCS7471132.1 DUF4347 domain-containing protein [Stieleria sedimenti]